MVKIFACGVNEYRGCNNLSFCVNDAVTFCKTFEENFVVEKSKGFIKVRKKSRLDS